MQRFYWLAALFIFVCSWTIAQNGEYTTWNEDGSLTITTFEDGETITLAPEDIGSLFGPGKKPFEGASIAITVNNSGPKGGISGPLYRLRPAWEELTGATLEIVEMPLAEQLPTTINDLSLGLNQFDGFMAGAWYMGEYVTPGYIIPVDEWIADGRFFQWDPNWWPPSLKNIHQWEGQTYATMNDSDGQVLYWRDDILSSPDWQAQYEAEVGSPMPYPIRTWDDVIAIAQFFDGKNWDENDADPDSGIVMHFRVNEQGMFHFMSMSASYVVRGGDTVDRCTNNYWFDPATMEPLINSEGHVRALEKLVELSQYGPDAQVGWDLGTAWDYFLRGKSIFVFSWGDVGALVQDTARSKIQGKLGASILPGSTEVYNMCSNAWETLEAPNVVGNTTGGSWHGIISSKSENPEVVYSLYSFMAAKPVHLWNIYRGWTGVDPGVSTDFLPPNGDADLQGYLDVGWNENDVKVYTQAYYDNFFAETMLPYLRINGAEEYWRALDQNLSKAMVGELDAKTALDNTAASWVEITERRGLDLQLQQYQQSMGYKAE
jgi:multiple sugar transport system substrate-binding protein